MKKIILILSIFCISLFASSSVWKVSKNGNHIYIGGTIHILSKDDYPLPDEFRIAYNNSQVIVFEADLGKMGTAKSQRLLQMKSAYSGNEDIRKYLKEDTLRVLTQHLRNEGFPVDRMLKLKPGILTTYITLKELKDLGISEIGVDGYFERLAKQDRKKLIYLERIEDQIDFITNIGIGNEENYINYSMSELKNISRDMNKMRAAWRSGDINILNKKDMDILQNKFPRIYKNVLVNRNKNWMPKLEKMFNTKEVEYVLFGALHLSGEDGILYKLRKLGYKIEKL